MKVIVVSDQHLGYEKCDKRAFNGFLDQLSDDAEVTDLVLLGDVVDMWRRDASGVFLENRDTMDRMVALKERIAVHYVAGNHDYHVLKLQNRFYPLDFTKELNLRDGSYSYRFLHGYGFDPLQNEVFMEGLCHVMSDEAGAVESGAWAAVTRDWSDLTFSILSLIRKKGIQRHIEQLQVAPEQRLKETIGEVEKRACANVKPHEILVFGHTHRPFVNKTENVANSGSWVTDGQVHNTYIELSGGKPRLFVYGGQEITERYEC